MAAPALAPKKIQEPEPFGSDSGSGSTALVSADLIDDVTLLFSVELLLELSLGYELVDDSLYKRFPMLFVQIHEHILEYGCI